MTLRAKTAKSNRERLMREAKLDSAELAAIERDAHLTEIGRKERSTPIRARMQERYEATIANTRTLVEAAQAEYERALPCKAQLRAALKNPERAAALKALATGASVTELRELAAAAAELKDLAAAHGIRIALGSAIAQGTIDETGVSSVRALLEHVADAESELAMADFVAAKVEFDRLVAGGPSGNASSAVLADPVARLQDSRAAASYGSDGATIQISEAEQVRLQKIAGTFEE